MRIVNEQEPCQGIPPEHAEFARRLRTAEDRLFPLVMVDPDRYQWAVTLVGALARELDRTCGSWAELAGAAPGLKAVLPRVAAAVGVPLTALDADLVVEAAQAQRLRGLLADQAAERQRNLVEQARRAGERWALVEQPDAAAWSVGAARWVEIHVATGALLVRSVDPDAETGQPAYRLRLIPGDAGADGPQVDETFADRALWLDATELARRAIESES